MERLRATVVETLKDEKGKSQFNVILGEHIIGTSKTNFDARFHMHAINDAIDKAWQAGHDQGNEDGREEIRQQWIDELGGSGRG